MEALARGLRMRGLRLAAMRHPVSAPRTLTTRPVQRLCSPSRITSRSASHAPPNVVRWMSSRSLADEKIDEITELYATAKDEFEIAMDETQDNTVYAEDDRKAAREELTKLQEAFRAVVDGPDTELASEVQRRVGQRIRELEQGVAAMEDLAMNQD